MYGRQKCRPLSPSGTRITSMSWFFLGPDSRVLKEDRCVRVSDICDKYPGFPLSVHHPHPGPASLLVAGTNYSPNSSRSLLTICRMSPWFHLVFLFLGCHSHLLQSIQRSSDLSCHM